jgi:hypothetical protein
MSLKTININYDIITPYGSFKQKQTPQQKTKSRKTLKIKNTNILENIREVQSKLFENIKNNEQKPTAMTGTTTEKNNFEECRDFLNKKIKQPEQQQIKSSNVTYSPPASYANISKPAFGCLKNGLLPTFRNWKQQNFGMSNNITGGGTPTTTMMQPTTMQPTTMQPTTMQPTTMQPTMQPTLTTQFFPQSPVYIPSFPNKDKIFVSETIQHQDKKKEDNQKPKSEKQKTIKKTHRHFNIGKNKTVSKVGVLISNTSIRNTIKQKCNELKTKPIADVKKDLIKKGLIKIGSSAPNDVLRKMFEASSLLCGEIQNHNNETILHNYLENKKIDE